MVSLHGGLYEYVKRGLPDRFNVCQAPRRKEDDAALPIDTVRALVL
jgi:hypothetical protein